MASIADEILCAVLTVGSSPWPSCGWECPKARDKRNWNLGMIHDAANGLLLAELDVRREYRRSRRVWPDDENLKKINSTTDQAHHRVARWGNDLC